MANYRLLKLEIRKSLEAKVDRRYLEKIRELVPSDSPILGVRVPDIRSLVRPFQNSHKKLDFDSACSFVDVLFKGRCREEMLFGIFFLTRYKRNFSKVIFPKIDSWIDVIDNWEICDQLAMNVAGEILAKDLSLLKEVKSWTKSSNFWRRRFAVATTTVLNQKGRSFSSETIDICKNLLKDDAPSVQKAVGWALREACKHDHTSVYELLVDRKDRIHPKILREASQKLSSSQRKALSL